MAQIVTTKTISKILSPLNQQHKRIVLVGGCFDLLHIGHITFLEEAKKQGDVLIVMLESDEAISKSKGKARPINTQEIRARIVAALSIVDFVVLLTSHMSDKDYDTLVFSIKPAIIATTKGDPGRHHKERAAQRIGAKVVDVTPPILDKSTTKLIQLLNEL